MRESISLPARRAMALAAAILVMLFSLALAGGAAGREAVPVGDDEALERRVMALAEELRCLVCQNQTIADSHADLAEDLRNQIRDQLRAGSTEQQVKQYMVARYGDFVLYKPLLKATTVLLWAAPGLLAVGGCVWLFVYLRRRNERLKDAGPESDDGLDDDAIGEGGA